MLLLNRFHPSYDAALRPSLAKAALKRKTSESGFRIVPTEIDNTSACLRDENEVQRSDSSMTAKPHAKAVSKLSYSPLQHIAIPPMVENHPNGSQTREEMKASKPSLVSHAKNSKNSPLSSQLSLEPPLKTPTKSSREASFRTSKRFSRRSPVGPISDEVEDTISSFLNNLPPLRPTSTLAFLHVPWHETALDFHELSPLEQRLYTLQKGAPLNGSTLPETWPQVQRILLDEGEFNWEEFRSKGGLNWIMELYEHVRIGIEAFWRSTPEPANNRDWTLLYAEGFDVFDTKPGSKYWKHYRHSIVQPTSSKIELSQFFEVANSENEGQRESLAPTVPRIDESDPKDLVSPNTDYGMPDIAHGSEVLEDPYEDNEFNDTDLDQTLVDIMGESAPASGPVIGSQELRDLLSPVEQFLATDQGRPNAWTNDPSSALPEVQGEGPSSLAILPKRSLRAPVSSAKTLVASANTVNEQDGSTKVQRAKKRKDRASNGIVVHEDSPSRAPTTDNHVSPGTDTPKENFGVEELVNLGDNHTGTSSNSRRRVASGTPTAPRFIHLGNMSMNSP